MNEYFSTFCKPARLCLVDERNGSYSGPEVLLLRLPEAVSVRHGSNSRILNGARNALLLPPFRTEAADLAVS